MASLKNRFFLDNKNDQTIMNSLIKESIQIQGRTMYYLPRDAQVKDLILGEDVVSAFTLAIPLEMYMKDVNGYDGQREMFSKFGLQIQNSYKLVVSVDRWNQEVKSRFDNNTTTFQVDNYVRPHEGDLIYDPLTKFLMVLKFVDHDTEFYALGKNYMYHLSCESFLYQNEKMDTSIPEIDAFNDLSMDDLNFQLMTESGIALRQENGSYLLQEESPNPEEPVRWVNEDYTLPAKSISVGVKTTPFNM